MPNLVRKTNYHTFYKTSVTASFIFLGLTLALTSNATETASHLPKAKIETMTDLRIIVDISGSMKKTDPNNLRRPAIRLLAGLIPQGSRAGIWNFGKQVNMAVKIGIVNDAWREQARAESKNISSIGLFTNIEKAMEQASFDWKEPDPRYQRNLILLTDGHVDISQDDKLDAASRKRILKEILPALEKAKVRIHTIALSDDVDENLLSALSAYTDGLYKKVSSADDLQKLFLQMLEQSVKLDTLPIIDNHFNVDASVNDMTLLVFNKDKAHPTKIVTPGKKTWDEKNNSTSVKWYSDQGYDLITIKKPQHGQWKMLAPADKNNRVVVATNLKLKLNELPSFAILGDVFNVHAQLYEDGKPLTDKRLLSKFKFTLKRTKKDADDQLYPMSKLAGDESTYSIQLPPIFKAGNNAFVIQAKSPTVEREINHQLTVYNVPANVRITKENKQFKISVIPHSNLIRPDSVKITSEAEDKNKYILVQYGKEWVLNVNEKYKGKVFTINIDAIRADGKPMSVSFNKVLEASDEVQELVIEEKKEQVHTITKVKEHKKKEVHGNNKNTKDSNVVPQKPEAEINWTVVIVSIVIGNILLIVVLGGGYFYMRRRKEKMRDAINNEMNEEGGSIKETSAKEAR